MNYSPTTVARMREFGETVLSHLESNDPRISGSVRINHPDGSSSVVACAFTESPGDWLFVFSLIDGFILYGKDEVSSWHQESEFVRTRLAHAPTAQGKPVLRVKVA